MLVANGRSPSLTTTASCCKTLQKFAPMRTTLPRRQIFSCVWRAAAQKEYIEMFEFATLESRSYCWQKGDRQKPVDWSCMALPCCVWREICRVNARTVDVVIDWAVCSGSLFCQEQQNISRGVDCDILQDQLVLGSCIVGYDLQVQLISAEHLCVECVRQKKTIVCNNSSVNAYASSGSEV